MNELELPGAVKAYKRMEADANRANFKRFIQMWTRRDRRYRGIHDGVDQKFKATSAWHCSRGGFFRGQ